MISRIWLTNMVVLAAGAMPLVLTKLKYSFCPKKIMTANKRVKGQPPKSVANKARAIATIALTIRDQAIDIFWILDARTRFGKL